MIVNILLFLLGEGLALDKEEGLNLGAGQSQEKVMDKEGHHIVHLIENTFDIQDLDVYNQGHGIACIS